MARPKRIDWSSVRLEGRTLREVAAELGVSHTAVSQAKRRMLVGYTCKQRGKKTDWSDVDLRDDAHVIAAKKGVHVTTVYKARSELGVTANRRNASKRVDERVRTFEDFEREFPE